MAYRNIEDRRIKEVERASRNREKLSAYKLKVGCADCGYSEDPRALEFDHLPEHVKVRNVSTMVYSSWRAIWEEAKKCEVVCANCHAIRTHERRN